MALLTNDQRREVWATFMAGLSTERENIALFKAEVRDFLNAADQWVSDNQASYNSALPAVAQSALTASQKARGLTLIVGKRFQEGVV